MPTGRQQLRCVISIDVEEEGLFKGRYERAPSAANVRHLKRLHFCSRDYGIPLTLLTAYPVTQDEDACQVLRACHDDQGAELGAHLHHWNTPPFQKLNLPEPVRCSKLPPDLLRSKLQTLTDAIHNRLGVQPRSFRMGRFDFCEALPPILADLGYTVDSSLAPLRCEMHGPDHFAQRAELHELGHGLLEAPLTTTPVSRTGARLVELLGRRLSYKARIRLQRAFGKSLCAGVHPLMFPLASMKLAARLHAARGGDVLNVFLHSSELMPGGSPQVPDEAAARALADKLRRWLDWLCANYDITGCTLSELAQHNRP